MKTKIYSKDFENRFFIDSTVTMNSDPWLIENEWDADNFVNGLDWTMTKLEGTEDDMIDAIEKLDLNLADSDTWFIYSIEFQNGDRGLVAFPDDFYIR